MKQTLKQIWMDDIRIDRKVVLSIIYVGGEVVEVLR